MLDWYGPRLCCRSISSDVLREGTNAKNHRDYVIIIESGQPGIKTYRDLALRNLHTCIVSPAASPTARLGESPR